MHNLIKYIAHFLLMVLLFPIVYQGIHMVHHHHNILPSMHSEDSGLCQTIQNEICHVGEFEFTSFDIVSTYFISTTIQYCDNFVQHPYHFIPDQFNGYNFALRAPPVMG